MKRLSGKLSLCCILIAVLLSGCALFDQTPPTIEGKSPSVEYGTTLTVADIANVTDDYSEVEAVLQQASGGNISDDGTSVTFDTPGDHTVKISATDARGNSSEADCPVTVLDNTAPKLSVGNNSKIGYGTVLTLADTANAPDSVYVECEDVSDVSLAIRSVEKSGNGSAEGCYLQNTEKSVTLTQVGDYILTIEATDAFGNSSTAQAAVSAVDLTPPAISGLSQIKLSEQDALPDFLSGVTAVDEIDGDLSQQMTVNSSSVQKGVPGTYKVRYSVTDSSGNDASAERTVQIQDTTPPTIKLSKTSLSYTIGGSKPDYKSMASASDAIDGDRTNVVSVDDSEVDYSKAGTYTVKYTVKDDSGNTATKTLKVSVREKAKPNTTTNPTTGNDRTVYITNTGEKYHSGGCRYLKKSKIAISRSDARNRGYTPCKVCGPG